MRFVLLSFGLFFSSASLADPSLFTSTPLTPILNFQTASLKLAIPEPPLGGLLHYSASGSVLSLYENKAGLSLLLKMKGVKGETGEICEHDFTQNTPLKLNFGGMPNGLPRYYVKLDSCTIFLDRLEDSSLMQGGKCVTSSGCTIDAIGLWGASTLSLNEKLLDKGRMAYEKRLNTARKALMKAYNRKPILASFISEQIDFNAHRASQCENLDSLKAQWCALRYTQVRALELESKLANR